MPDENSDQDEDSINLPEIPVPELPKDGADAKAALEESALALGVDLKRQRVTNDVRRLVRQDRIDKFVHVIECLFIIVVGVLIVVGAFAIGWHHLTPEKWHYLNNEELGDLQGLLFNGVVGGAVASLAKKHIIDR